MSGRRVSRASARSCSISMAEGTVSVRHTNCPRMKARRWRGITTWCRCRSITGSTRLDSSMSPASAVGLIHRASVQSGGGGNIPTAEQQKEYAREIVKELGLGAHDIEALQKLEWSKLNKAGMAVSARMYPRGAGATGPFGPPRAGWSPSIDGHVITMRSFSDAAPEI